VTGTRGLRRFVAGPAAPAGQGTSPPAAPAAPAAPGPVPAPRPAAAPADAGLPVSLFREPDPAAAAVEKCELCAAEIPAEHGHIADLEASSLACACRACYLLFTQPTAGRGRYRSVPDRFLRDPGAGLTAAEWDELEIPVGLAFFLNSSLAGQTAGFYPSPAGVTECILDLAAWERLAAEHPLLAAAAPDVEAVLIARVSGAVESFVVPIDACYELAGRMRLQWRGFDGGDEARASIDEFLAGVRARARPLDTGGPA
jgi:hypothetical protein